MRSTIIGEGRHRIGLAGLIPVRHFVTVTQRSFFARFFGGFKPGRHHARNLEVVPEPSVALHAAAA